MNNLKLSIIIPCYNCAKTLEESVASIYKQKFENYSFEVVMVDDGSTDNTKELMETLSQKHSEIKIFFHKKNQGGGATRNTAVKNSVGELIFCLDSDDILGDNMLPKMLKFIEKKKCDGVGISKSIKFKGQNIKNISYITNFSYIDEKIPFESLFENNSFCPLYSTFLITKKAFQITKGYPTEHGFDTQGFAFRFLANNLTAYGCPETEYFHRVSFNKSYYLREYESGKSSHNMFKIFEEFLFLFNTETQDEILNFDLNNHKKSLIEFLINKKNKFTPDFKSILKNDIIEIQKNNILNLSNETSKQDLYWLANEYYKKKKFKEASSYFYLSINKGLDNQHAYYKLIDSLGKQNNSNFDEISKKIESLLNYKPLGSKLPIYKRILNKVKNI